MKTLNLRIEDDLSLAQVRLVMPGDGFGDWSRETATWSHLRQTGTEPLVEFYRLPHPSQSSHQLRA